MSRQLQTYLSLRHHDGLDLDVAAERAGISLGEARLIDMDVARGEVAIPNTPPAILAQPTAGGGCDARAAEPEEAGLRQRSGGGVCHLSAEAREHRQLWLPAPLNVGERSLELAA